MSLPVLTLPSQQLVSDVFHAVTGDEAAPFVRSQPLSTLGLDPLQRLEFISTITSLCKLTELPDLTSEDPTPDALFDAVISASLNNNPTDIPTDNPTEWRIP